MVRMRSSDPKSSVDPAATKSPSDCAAERSAGHGRQYDDSGNTRCRQNQDNPRRAASAAGPGGNSGRAFPGDQPDLPDIGTASLRWRVASEGIPYRTGLLMAVVYVFCPEPRCGPSPLLRGVLYGSLMLCLFFRRSGRALRGNTIFIRCGNRWLRCRSHGLFPEP
jgi:hypothetical protein